MSEEKAIALLKTKNQRVSAPRVALLAFFIAHPGARCLTEIQRYFHQLIDRVTVYRTLHVFVETGLLLRFFDKKGNSLYLFHHYNSNIHPHLKCRCCDAILCLPALPEDYLKQLKPFQIKEMSFLLEGVCKDCVNNQPD